MEREKGGGGGGGGIERIILFIETLKPPEMRIPHAFVISISCIYCSYIVHDNMIV